MENRVVWKTAQGHSAPLLSLKKRGKKSVILTTAMEFQRSGRIDFFWEDNRGKVAASTIRITRLPPNHPGDPVLTLKSSYNGKSRLKITANTAYGSLCKRKLKVPPRFRAEQKNIVPLFPLVSAVGAVALGAVFLVLYLPPIRSEISTETEPQQQSINLPDEGKKGNEQKNTAEPVNSDSETSLIQKEDDEQPQEPEPPAPPPPIEVTLYFLPESAEITPEAAEQMDELKYLLDSEQYSRLRIIGHCALFGTEEERLDLSHRRVQKTAAYLEERLRLPEERVLKGEGGKSPVTVDPEQQELNRRVEILLIP